ncbi:MaoC family dehydratase [Roseomonas sp. SSH11]|uniref:MaoC family dehydratase n=1 Tax=Pararoseomonas baculiformis TaxID=2820812 RepID=A0ABS4ABN2_9PROT|nr:MaoC family dehydratase [Pararoseomonas baculiformis]MBP0444281.1 MaoC family dehydratase [Pararoseomonas baculiformis]
MDGMRFEDLSLGQSARFAKTITEADILLFSAISGDNNPVHLDAEAAATSFFGERVAHGMLTASLISGLLGTRLPGPGAVYVSQSLKFRAPVRIGQTVVAEAEVVALDPARRRATLRTTCSAAGVLVVEGEAVVMIPPREAAPAG